ncbi:MAG: MoxR family ATPase [Myxococcales bacterium]|nr:MoxR family ATPase [Myxococcales bacterium]
MPQPQPQLQPDEVVARIEAAVGRVIRGKNEVVRLLLTALFARGHVLIEDVPGVGKTTLARTIAAAVGGTFRRVQFTSDLLPSDILGVSVYNQADGSFDFKKGPIFANVVLADEINRTSPRTQSALMEVLNEGHVTVDNETYALDAPFMVIATQNPAEHFGTYPLPESQMDRFLLRLVVGYPAPHEERRVIAERGGFDPVTSVESVVDHVEIRATQKMVDSVRVDAALLDYMMAVIAETRRSPFLALGVSTRGGIAWYRAAQAYALVNGRDYCVPDDFKKLARPCLAHRVVLMGHHDSLTQSREEAERALAEVLERVAIPL